MSCRAPVLFYKPVTALIGPLANIIIPKVAQPVGKHLPDYEVELTIVIGKSAKNVSEKDALDYVLAYTGGNDVRYFVWDFLRKDPIYGAKPSRYPFASTRCASRSGIGQKVLVCLSAHR